MMPKNSRVISAIKERLTLELPKLARPTNLSEIVMWDAVELSSAIHDRVVTCVEVMTAYLDQIDRVNPQVNALVAVRSRGELIEEALAYDELLNQGKSLGWMHGFPQAIKDLSDVQGWPTTSGFFRPPFEASPAVADAIFVERIRAAGAIFIGRTNTPEFGLGSHTYNNVYGTTRNAFDPLCSAGGSSGGAAVAVATRMLPVADGSDFMGSLRNPPGWNNVLGLRTSVGRVPASGGDLFTSQGGVSGPIARTAQDLAILLATMSGYDIRDPLSIRQDPKSFLRVPETNLNDTKIAWLGDLGGYLPMESEVLEVTRRALSEFEAAGVEIIEIDELPSYGSFAGNTDLWPTWLTYRHWSVASWGQALYERPELRAKMKPELIYEIEGAIGAEGHRAMTALEFAESSRRRSDFYEAMRRLFDTVDAVAIPTAQMFPFDATLDWPKYVDGRAMSSYHRWMEATTIATLINAPAIALPAGFGVEGLPIGIQFIGPNQGEQGLLALALAWERLLPFATKNLPAMVTRDP